MAFDQEDDEGELLANVAHIDSMITLVDARHFLHDWERGTELATLGVAVDELDDRTLSDLLAEQVEFATQVVINKVDLVTPGELARLQRIIECLNPEAEIITSMFGMVEFGRLVGRGLYEENQSAPTAEPNDALEERLGIGSFVYRARRPFHPERLWSCLHEAWPGVMRSKGLFWLASRMNESGLWAQAGHASSHQSAGRWWSSVSPELWPDDENIRGSIEAECQGPYGDRRQEIVVIGEQLDEAALRQRLDACLLDDSEMQMGPMGWTQLPDPFPAWEPDDADETDLTVPVQRRPMPTA
jgi:G3E family GTPase